MRMALVLSVGFSADRLCASTLQLVGGMLSVADDVWK